MSEQIPAQLTGAASATAPDIHRASTTTPNPKPPKGGSSTAPPKRTWSQATPDNLTCGSVVRLIGDVKAPRMVCEGEAAVNKGVTVCWLNVAHGLERKNIPVGCLEVEER